jgi:GntR family transcriptional regulator
MLERQAPVPLYYQIELRLREDIESGKYHPGDRLPTEKELQERYDVSRVTVRTALRRLEEDGLISTHRGRGTFVTTQGTEAQRIERDTTRLHSFEEDIARQGGEPRIEVLSLERVPVPQRIAALLDVPDGTEVTRIRRLGLVGDAPLWIESRYVHPDIDDRFLSDDADNVSIIQTLESQTGRRVDRSRLRITAASATNDQANHLQVAKGAPVLINEFVDFSQGKPIEAARAVFRGDRYAFSVEVFGLEAGNTPSASQSFLGANGAQSIIRQEVST